MYKETYEVQIEYSRDTEAAELLFDKVQNRRESNGRLLRDRSQFSFLVDFFVSDFLGKKYDISIILESFLRWKATYESVKS